MTEEKSQRLKQRHALALVRTPFQAWLVERVLKAEEITSFDLCYFTQNNSPEDKFYFDRLVSRANASKYIFVRQKKPDLLNHICFSGHAWPAVFWKTYDVTVFSSIDSYSINAIANRRLAGELVTFDDGTANYNQMGVYFNEPSSLRGRIYRHCFLAKSITATRSRIARHYTIHSGLDNIVDSDRLLSIAGWGCQSRGKKTTEAPIHFFIGAPFQEVLDSPQVRFIETHARDIGVDVYVRHPRESEPLDLDAPFLDKRGRIAEEAILDDAGDRPIILIGFLSSVMFNLASCAARRIVLVPRDSQRHASLIELARKSGCEIVPLDKPE